MSSFDFRRLKPFQTAREGSLLKLSLPFPQSATGKVHRYCPSDECNPRRFQLGSAPEGRKIRDSYLSRARRLPGDTGTTCPYCGTDGLADAFHAPEDIEAAKEFVQWAVGEDLRAWIEDQANSFNRSLRGRNPLGISMTVRGGARPAPRPWRDDLLRDLTCDCCQRNYGVYAIALFCPDCGTPNLHVHFLREAELIGRQIDLATAAERDGEPELAYRLLANAHEDVLTAFETYQKTVYRFIARSRLDAGGFESLMARARGNPFQNPDRAERLFQELAVTPYSVLEEGDRRQLAACIGKRHVIGHNLGLADERYLALAPGSKEGESVVVLAAEITSFAILCLRVVGALEGEYEFRPRNTMGGP